MGYFWRGLFLIGVLLGSLLHLHAKAPFDKRSENLHTYFSYDSAEVQKLAEISSKERMSHEELIQWDEIARELSSKHPLGDAAARMYAYLYTAQREAAFLSYNSHGEFTGSLGPISSKVLKLFFAAAPSVQSDGYSDYLAQIVLAKIVKRLEDENAHMRNFPIQENDPRLNTLPKPHFGLKNASCKPWLLQDPKEFRPPAPPSREDPYWKEQSEIVKAISDKSTEEQKKRCKFWAGMGSAKNGDAIAIASDYMFKHSIPFAKIVCVRSILAEAGVDVDIALFLAKYSYVIIRPPVVNSAIQPLFPFPKHPSYPSGHSTWFPTWATLMTHYFPDKKEHWFKLAKEAGLSRIAAGIHYPIDHKNGWELGLKLGNAMLQSPKLCL